MELTTLEEHLEVYLKHEGLYNAIPEHRRPSLFILPLAHIWLAGLWILAAYILLEYKGWASW